MKPRAKSLIRLAIIGGCLFFIFKFVVALHVVVGDSMTPTLKSWDLCLMRRVYHYQPKRGDIVVFRTAEFDEQGRLVPPLYYVKRVVGLPGDTVAISNGVFLINAALLPEPYTTVNLEWQKEATTLPMDKIFVMGDNRELPLEDYPVPGPVALRLVTTRMLGHWRWRR